MMYRSRIFLNSEKSPMKIFLFFAFFLFSFLGFAQEFNFDYLLTYKSQYGQSKESESVTFLDSKNPYVKMTIYENSEKQQMAMISDYHMKHNFRVLTDENNEMKFRYAGSVKVRPSGIIEKASEVKEVKRPDGKYDVSVSFYLHKKKGEPRMTYHFVMRQFDFDFASPFLPSFFDSVNRATLTKFERNYLIESVSSKFWYYEPTVQSLQKIQKISNPIKIEIEKQIFSKGK